LGLSFISTRFTRGDTLTKQEFIDKCHHTASKHFWDIVNSDKVVPMMWHKQHIPEYFGCPKIVTILLDQSSYKWYHRALWYKKYGIKNKKIHIKADDPLHNPSRAEYFKIYNNPYLIEQHPYSFIKQNILRAPGKNIFGSPNNFADGHKRVFITLSDLLNVKTIGSSVNQICEQLELEKISREFILNACNYWKGCHDTFMPKYS
jgi:hypothetical protein